MVACNAVFAESSADCSGWPPAPPVETENPWGHPMVCEMSAEGRPEVVSLGTDGLPGGSGWERDIRCWVRWPKNLTIPDKQACACRMDPEP